MMDSLILDSLSTQHTQPYAYTKITTHRPVKKATSTNNLSSNMASNMPIRGSNKNLKNIPTQGKSYSYKSIIM